MKKILITILGVILFITSSNVQAEESSSIIKDARNSIGMEFNSTVKKIKTYLKSSDEDIKSNTDSIDTAKEEIDNLKSSSLADENNPTVLDHGDAALPSCSTSVAGFSNESSCRDVHDLVWNSTKWVWKKPEPKADCNPSSGEVKVADGNGGFICKQNGTYTSTTDGYGPCIEPAGRKYSQSVCMFKNTASGKTYQVAASNCGASAAPTSKLCGHDWAVSGYGACMRGNIKSAIYQCQERATGKSVSDSKCLQSRPSSTTNCSAYTYTWAFDSYGPCQSDSKQYRSSTCKESPGNISVSGSYCGSIRPTSSKSCNYYTGSWSQSAYSSCSVSACGQTGVQTASYSCVGGPCSGTQPANVTKACSTPACNYTYAWRVGSYGACISGWKTRDISCIQSPGNKVVSDSSCPPSFILKRSKCVSYTYSWRAGAYGKCTNSKQTRTVECRRDQDNAFAFDQSCSGIKPATSKSCSSYTYSWSTGSYGSCSGGTQTRSVTCKRNPGNTTVSSGNCTSVKPATSKTCVVVDRCATYGACHWEAMGQEAGNDGRGCDGVCRTYNAWDICCGSRGYKNSHGGCTGTKGRNGEHFKIVDPVPMRCKLG